MCCKLFTFLTFSVFWRFNYVNFYRSSGRIYVKSVDVFDKCSLFKPNAWGLKRCIGCDMCDCAIASKSTQCNDQTGQCFCMPGAAGVKCEACAQGYWNYTASGCTSKYCSSNAFEKLVYSVAFWLLWMFAFRMRLRSRSFFGYGLWHQHWPVPLSGGSYRTKMWSVFDALSANTRFWL